jgi:hypothetical protein
MEVKPGWSAGSIEAWRRCCWRSLWRIRLGDGRGWLWRHRVQTHCGRGLVLIEARGRWDGLAWASVRQSMRDFSMIGVVDVSIEWEVRGELHFVNVR